MMNVQAVRVAPTIQVVEAIPFNHEVFKRAGGGLKLRSDWFVRHRQRGIVAACSAAVVLDDARLSDYAHGRGVIRQLQERPRRPHREPAPRIETEKVDPRSIA